MASNLERPIGSKSYGSIPHLPGSRQGRGDIGIAEGQARILTERARDANDVIIVEQKVDGSNVAVANVVGELVAITRGGFRASQSQYEQHQHFHVWVERNRSLFDFLGDGERVCGEWMGQAVGTMYELPHIPFVAFDIRRNRLDRAPHQELTERVAGRLPMPRLISKGPPVSVEDALAALDPAAHGALELVEGAVWRVERNGKFDFIAKFVRHEKEDGKYLPQISQKPAVWLWHPERDQ